MKIGQWKMAKAWELSPTLKHERGSWKAFVDFEKQMDKAQEPRTMDLADGGRIGFKHGGMTLSEFIEDKISKGEATFETKGDLLKEWGGKSGGNNYETIKKYEDQIKFKRKSRLGGDTILKDEKILEFFDKQEPGSKINVERSVKEINKNLPKDQQISESIITSRLKDTKFNTNFLGSQTLGQYHGELSDSMKHNIIAKFGDEYDITMDSFNKNKYGISAGGRKDKKGAYEMIRRAVSDKNTQWNKAYNVSAADGWILNSMERAGFKPIMGMIGDRERVVGYEDPDGTKWFSSKDRALKNNGKYVKTAHPGWDRVNHLVNIVKETRVAPNDAIIDMLKKGTGVKNIDGITLESLTGYLLDNNADVKNIKKGLRTFPKHHVKGVKGSYADDIQLVTRIANERANSAVAKIEALKKQGLPISDEVYNAIDTELKNLDVTIDIDGKRLGSTGTGFESKADIERFVTKKIGDWKTADFEKFAKQFIKNDVKFASFPANIGAMWKSMGSVGRKTLGWGTAGLTELIFMGLDMKNELSKGKSTEEAASIAQRNASFGVYNDGAYLKELKKVAEDMDIDTQAFDKAFAMNERMFKVGQQQDYYQAKIDKLKTMGPQGIEEAAKMQQAYDEWQSGIDAENEKLIEGIAGQVAISKAGKVFPNPNLDQIAKARYTLTNDEFGEVFTGIKEAGIEKLKREKTKAFDVQSKQADPEAGSTFNWLTNFFTGTENFLDWRTKGQEEQRLIDEMEGRERYLYNLQRGVDPDSPITQESFENLISEQPGLGYYSGGGIASLKKK